MQKYTCYNEIDLRTEIYAIYNNLEKITGYFAMISQQLDGKRKNIDSKHIKEDMMPKINNIVKTLNDFDVIPHQDLFSIDQKIKDLEKIMKEEIY